MAIIKFIGAKRENVYELSNIPSVPRSCNKRDSKNINEGKFVFLSRIHPKKNLLTAIEYFKEISSNVEFDIYGPIEDEEYWGECKNAIKRLPDNIKVHYCGLVTHEEVHDIFIKHDALLFPTLSENYGHVIAESLSVGTVVIISDQTPWRDLQKNNAGWDIELSCKEKFVAAIESIIQMSDKEYEEISKNAKEYFDRQTNFDKLINSYYSAFSREV